MQCTLCVFGYLSIFSSILLSIVDSQPSHCKDVTTTWPKATDCPPVIDLVVLILTYESSAMYSFMEILNLIVKPCSDTGYGKSNITFIVNVTTGGFLWQTFTFDSLPNNDNLYVNFAADSENVTDILGAIAQTVSNRSSAMTSSILYTPAIYIFTDIACTTINTSYPHTMEMLRSKNTTDEMGYLTMPVRIFLTETHYTSDGNDMCNLEELQLKSQGYLIYEEGISPSSSRLEYLYGFCELYENTTTAMTTTPRTSTKTSTSVRTTTRVTTTTPYRSTTPPTLLGSTTRRDDGTTTSPSTHTTATWAPPTSTTAKPDPKKPNNHVLAWVLGTIGVAMFIALLVCLAGMARRIFFPQLKLWDTALGPAAIPKDKDVESNVLARNQNSYAEVPKHAVFREKEPDNDIWEVVPSQLLITEQRLGSGAYAVVHKAVLSGVPPVYKKFPALQLANILSDTENVVAAKTPKKHATLEERLEFLQEVEFMKRLDYYPHLLSMIGCSSSVQYPVLLTEYCALGDLLHLVRALDGSSEAPQISFGDLVPICWQMSDALAYLGARKIIHRDVAARNVLVTTDKMAKLSDFGLCRTDEQMMYTTRGGKLPIKWMAPESLDYAVFSAKTDVWSYGILLYEVFSFGKTPFITVDADILAEHLKEGNRLNIPERTPPKVSDLMRECWMERPEDRPDITVIRENLYSMMEAESDGYGYLTFSKNYYDVFKKKLHNIDEVYEV